MAYVPTVPDFRQYDFTLGDTDAAITKDNGRNAALVQFGGELRQSMTTFNEDLDQVAEDKQAAATSAGEALQYRNETQEISEEGLPPKAGNAGAILRVADDEQSYILDKLLRHLLPVGEIKGFPATVAPPGFLKVNGDELSRTTYADLWEYAQSSGNLADSEAGKDPAQFGPGDGATTFTIPDYRGEFPRWWDDGRGVDPGRGIGESQGDQNKAHDHGGGTGNNTHTHSGSTDNDTHNHSGNTSTDNHSHDLTQAGFSTSGNSDVASVNHIASGSNTTGRDAAFIDDLNVVSDSHGHSLNINNDTHSHGLNINSNTHNHDISPNGGNQARPRNMPLLACIRY